MTSHFQNNIKAFKKNCPEVAGLADTIPESMEVFGSRKGPVTARYRGRLLHSAYDPVKEADAFSRDIPGGCSIGLYGFGLGYHIESLLEKIGPGGKLLAIELNSGLLATAFQVRDLTHLAEDPRFELVFGAEEKNTAERITQAMPALMQEDSGIPRFLFHPASFECLPEAFPNIAIALEVIRLERRVPVLFGDLEQSNAEHNRDAVLASPGIRQLYGRYANRPGVLVSAGPSLDGLRPFLPFLSRHCILGCVDTALPVLSTLGVTPHFVFSLDPQDASFSHFEPCLDGVVPLVFTPSSNPKIIRNYKSEHYVVFKEGHAATVAQEPLAREKGLTQAGGSVSCLALDCLLKMGCDPVFLIGQDCAHSGNRPYASTGTPAAPAALETRDHRQSLIPVAGCQGAPIPTTHTLYSYLRTLEQIIEANPQQRVFNLSSQGARIAGAPEVGTLGELLPLLNQEKGLKT